MYPYSLILVTTKTHFEFINCLLLNFFILAWSYIMIIGNCIIYYNNKIIKNIIIWNVSDAIIFNIISYLKDN